MSGPRRHARTWPRSWPTRRTEQEQAHEERRTLAEAELTAIREHAEQLRADGEAAHERAQHEAKRITEQSAQQLNQTRVAADALMKSARTQIQQELQSARAKNQQEMAQWQANVEREVNERRTAAEQDIAEQQAAAEQELAEQSSATEQQIAALLAEAQQHVTELRNRADEQAASHQQQLTALQQEIEERQQEAAELHAELDTGRQQLAEIREEGETLENELSRMQQRLSEVRRDLTAESARLEEARRAGDSAERHAKEVRARVQREAKRVADLAAAAVMAAAAGGTETAEYPMVGSRSSFDRPSADRSPDRSGRLRGAPTRATGLVTTSPPPTQSGSEQSDAERSHRPTNLDESVNTPTRPAEQDGARRTRPSGPSLGTSHAPTPVPFLAFGQPVSENGAARH